MKKQDIVNELNTYSPRSVWDRGVVSYALEITENLSDIEDYFTDNSRAKARLIGDMLNGSPNWSKYSWDANSLIYNHEIAEMLLPPSVVKKINGRSCHKGQELLDLQATALQQAQDLIIRIIEKSQ